MSRVEIERRLLVEDDGGQRHARLRGDRLGDHHAFDRRHDRQDGVLRGLEHPDAVERRRGDRGRIGRAVRLALDDARRIRAGGIEQAALRPAHEQAVRAVPQREPGLEAAAGRGPGHRAYVIERGRRLRRTHAAGIGEQRLRVLDVGVAVDDGEGAAEVDVCRAGASAP